MVDPPPLGGGDAVALSLREGAWLALLGSLAMVARRHVAALRRHSDALARGMLAWPSGWIRRRLTAAADRDADGRSRRGALS